MRYEQEKTHMYMVMDAVGNGASVGHEMKMMMSNTFESLLPVSVRSVDNFRSYYYDVTSKQQFSKMYEYRKLSRDNVDSLIASLLTVQSEIEEYMLEIDRVILIPDCIYVDAVRDRFMFAYGAGDIGEEIEDFGHGLKRLFEFVIEHFDHSLGDADVIYVYNIYQRIAQGDTDISNLRATASSENESSRAAAKRQEDYCAEEFKLDTVADEIVEDEVETEDKTAAGIVNIGKAIAGILLVIFIGRLLAPSYVPIPVSDVVSFAMILVSAIVFAVLGRIPVHKMTIVKERKEAVPYMYRQDDVPRSGDETDGKSSKRRRNKKEKGLEQSEMKGDWLYGDSFECEEDCRENKRNDTWGEESYSCGNAKNNNDTEDYEQYGATVLLSDYLKQKKDFKVCLRYRDGDDALNRRIGRRDGSSGEVNVGAGNDGVTRDIEVEKLPWIIGSMDRHCDTIIRSRLVSHIHACITKVDDDYYIEDMNSTNGTYVNGERLLMNSRRKICESDVITLASISYVVELS